MQDLFNISVVLTWLSRDSHEPIVGDSGSVPPSPGMGDLAFVCRSWKPAFVLSSSEDGGSMRVIGHPANVLLKGCEPLGNPRTKCRFYMVLRCFTRRIMEVLGSIRTNDPIDPPGTHPAS